MSANKDQAPNLRLKPIDLVATTAHELKTPLTLITGLASMLEAGQFGELNSKQTHYINKINLVSERLLLLIESLLAVSKARQKRLYLQLEPISIPQIIRAVLEELDPVIKQKHINIKWRRRRSIEPVLADHDCLYQVIYNLIDNALKYSGSKTTITIRFRHQAGHLYLRVSDQGRGVKPNELKYLYRRFGKIKQPIQGQAGSTGLGLYIVKKLVESQNGRVRAKTLTKGTCFIIRLPLAQQLDLFTPLPKRSVKTVGSSR